jgi:uncharacterized membrane protein
MKKFFSPNIDARGRLVRGLGGGALVILGVFLCRVNLLAAVLTIIFGGFVFFEAVRGWCLMRACGIKTKL